MRPHTHHIVIATLIGAALSVTAPRSSCAQPAPPMSRLGWLTGVWRGQMMGGDVEDVYQPLANGEILSTMRLVVKGQTTRYEFRRIHDEGGRTVFQELAFGPGLVPAPPVPDRALRSIDAHHVEFEHLTLRLTGVDTMTVTLMLAGTGSDPSRTIEIHYTRALAFKPPHGPAGVSAASR